MGSIIEKGHPQYEAMRSFFSDGSSNPPRRKLIGDTFWIWVRDGDDLKFISMGSQNIDSSYSQQSFAEPSSPAQFENRNSPPAAPSRTESHEEK